MSEAEIQSTPPPPPGGSPPPSSGAPMVRIGEWFTASWETVKPVWLEYVIAYLVYQLVLMFASAMLILPGLLLVGPLTGGLYIYAAKRMEGMEVEVTDIFKGFSRFVELLIIGLVVALIPAVVAGIFWLPSMLAAMGAGATSGVAQEGLLAASSLASCLGCIVVPLFGIVYPVFALTAFVFAVPLVLFKNMKAIDALKKSYELVKPKFLNFLALLGACWVVTFVASVVGGILLVVGSLILVPLALSVVITMQLMAYREFVGLSKEDLAPYQ